MDPNTDYSYLEQIPEGLIKVHFVPHSHMDAGWLSTFEKYYKSDVKRIFSHVF